MYSPAEIRLRVKTAVAGRLILTDLFDPNWQLWVNTIPTVTERHDGMFRSVFLSAGEHQLQWSYQPWSVRWGNRLSIAGFTIWLMLGVGLFVRRRSFATLT